MSEKASVDDKKATVTDRKVDDKKASFDDKMAVAWKRTRRTKGYLKGGPFNSEEHRVFSAWIRQHEAELFQS